MPQQTVTLSKDDIQELITTALTLAAAVRIYVPTDKKKLHKLANTVLDQFVEKDRS